MIQSNRTWPALFLLQLTRGIALVDFVIMPVALPAIAQALGFARYTSLWIINIFQLCNTITLLLCGLLAKRFGERTIINGGSLLFVIGCIICAISQDIKGLLIGRSIMGIGAGFIQPLGSSIIIHTFSKEKRAWIASVSRIFFIGLILCAPLIAGLVIHYLSWQMIFWINVPLGIVCFIGCQLWITDQQKQPIIFPYLSALFSILGGGLLIFSIMQLWHLNWSAWQSLSAIAISSLFITLYIYRSKKDKMPLIPFLFFKYKLFILNILQMFFFSMSNGLLIFWILFFGITLKHTALSVGLFLFYCQLPAVVISAVATALLKRIGHRYLLLLLHSIWMFGILWMWWAYNQQQLIHFYVGVSCVMATLPTIASVGALWIVDYLSYQQHGGYALAIITSSNRYGNTIGLALLTALYNMVFILEPSRHAFPLSVITGTGFFLSCLAFVFVWLIKPVDQESFSKQFS